MPESTKDRLSGGKDGQFGEAFEHYGIQYRADENPMIFESAKLAEALTVLGSLLYTAPTRLIVDFDPGFPYSVIRRKGMSKVQPEHESSQYT